MHCDWRVNSYIRIILDDIFNSNNFGTELIWKRTGGHHLATKGFDSVTDNILWYYKSSDYIFNLPFELLEDKELEIKFPYTEKETGRRFNHQKLEKSSNISSRGEKRIIQGKEVTSNLGWIWTQATFDERLSKNPYLIYWTDTSRPRYKLYIDDYDGRKVNNLWNDVEPIGSGAMERIGYPTQKP